MLRDGSAKEGAGATIGAWGDWGEWMDQDGLPKSRPGLGRARPGLGEVQRQCTGG